jgi:hypothetical protein
MRENRVSARWRTLAILACGIAVGSLLSATPVYSHVGGSVTHLWTTHIRPKTDTRYYTKQLANQRYVNVDEAAAGDVTGLHSSLQVAPGAVGATEVADGSLGMADVIRFSGNVAIDPPSVPANSCIQATLTVPGMDSDFDEGWLYPSGNFFTSGALTINTYTSLNDDNDMRYSICNMGAVAVDPPNGSWHYLVVG